MLKTDILLFDSIGFSEAAVKAVIKLVYLTRHRYRWSIVLLSVLLVTWSVLSQVYKWCWIICTKGIFCQVSTNTLDQSTLDWHLAWHLINILADSQSREPTYFLKTVDYYIWVGWLSTDCWSSIERQPRINQDTNQLLIEGWILIEVLFKCWLRIDQEYQLTLHCGCVNCTQSFCWETNVLSLHW